MSLNATETDNIINKLALNIFEQGYDIRFQTAQAIPVFVNELITRFIYSIRRLFKYFLDTPKSEHSFSLMWEKYKPFSNPTIKRMLTVAHETFCLVDVGDAISNVIYNSLNTIQSLFDRIRNIPEENKLKYEKLKDIRTSWKQQVEKIEIEYKKGED